MENKYSTFWVWFLRNNELLFTFEKDAERILSLLHDELRKVDGNLTFEFGPIENNKREFILSADGIKESFGEVENLYKHKPQLKKWTIIKFRPRKDVHRFAIAIDGITYSPKDIYYRLINDEGKTGIVVFVKEYNKETHDNVVFIMLDMALGEYDVETKLGAIECFDFTSEYFKDALPFSTLPENFDAAYKQNLIAQLVSWHEDAEHEQIIEAIEQLPRSSWDFEISGLYARALNNLERYEEAMDQLFMFAEEGRENGIWNFRVGYSLYYLNREAEAAEYFQKAIDFGDDAEDTRELLKRSTFEAAMKSFLMDGAKLLESGERGEEKIQEAFDTIMTNINDCRNTYFGDDAEMKETVESMVSDRVQDIIEYFDLPIGYEVLLRKLDS